MHNRRVKGLSAEQRLLHNVLLENGYEAGEAGRLAASTINVLADMQDRQELSLAVRKSLAGMDRAGAGTLLDKTMLAMRNGETLDVGRWATELGIQGHFQPGRMVDLEPAIKAGAPLWPGTTPLDNLIKESTAYYDANIAGQKVNVPDLGEVMFRAGRAGMGKMLTRVHPDKMRLVTFLRELLAQGEYKGNSIPRREKHIRNGMTIHNVVAYARLGDKILGTDMTIRQDKMGQLYYDHFVFDYPRKDKTKEKTPPPESSSLAAEPARPKTEESGQTHALPLPSSREGTGRTSTSEISINKEHDEGNATKPTERELAETNAEDAMLLCNLTPDFTPIPPEPVMSPPPLEDTARMEREAVAGEGGSPLDLEATRLTGGRDRAGKRSPDGQRRD